MQISRTLAQPSVKRTQATQSAPHEQGATLPKESFSFSETGKTPIMVKVGKYALAAGTTAGAAALGYFASNNVGTAAAVAGVASGALAGATVLGTLGMVADIGGGIMGSSNKTMPMAIGGGVAGAIGGGLVGALTDNSAVGIGMGIAAGISALALTSAATNILAD
jgi:hypothetical protein